MVVSNEPGYYEANNFGIRIENLMIVVNKPDLGEFSGRGFLGIYTSIHLYIYIYIHHDVGTLPSALKNTILIHYSFQKETNYINIYTYMHIYIHIYICIYIYMYIYIYTYVYIYIYICIYIYTYIHIYVYICIYIYVYIYVYIYLYLYISNIYIYI
jgi:hypothetical protein